MCRWSMLFTQICSSLRAAGHPMPPGSRVTVWLVHHVFFPTENTHHSGGTLSDIMYHIPNRMFSYIRRAGVRAERQATFLLPFRQIYDERPDMFRTDTHQLVAVFVLKTAQNKCRGTNRQRAEKPIHALALRSDEVSSHVAAPTMAIVPDGPNTFPAAKSS